MVMENEIKARFLHMIFTIMQQEAETRCMAGK